MVLLRIDNATPGQLRPRLEVGGAITAADGGSFPVDRDRAGNGVTLAKRARVSRKQPVADNSLELTWA